MRRVKEFWTGIRVEVKRISWPDRKKLLKIPQWLWYQP